jgi:hypothetical protein
VLGRVVAASDYLLGIAFAILALAAVVLDAWLHMVLAELRQSRVQSARYLERRAQFENAGSLEAHLPEFQSASGPPSKSAHSLAAFAGIRSAQNATDKLLSKLPAALDGAALDSRGKSVLARALE